MTPTSRDRSSPPPETGAAVAVAAATLLVVLGTLVTSWLTGRPLGGDVVLHAGVLGALGLVWWTAVRLASREAGALLTAAAIIGVMFFLYTSLGHVAFEAIPWNGDPWVRTADRLLGLGREPALLLGDALARRPWTTEMLSAFYGLFMPYLYLSIILSLLGRPPEARKVFVLAFALLYGTSFMGYLFVPARGPVVEMASAFRVPLEGGYFHGIILRSIEAFGGPHGAFPSLHVGASFLAMTFDLRHGDRLRGLVYVPLVALIAVATLALRYHYLVDILAGVTIAWIALRLSLRWHRAGKPAGAGT